MNTKTSFKDLLLTEAFNSPIEYEVIKATNNKFITRQTINDRDIIFVADLSDDTSEADIEFLEAKKGESLSSIYKKGTYKITGSGGELKVFGMIINSMKEMIERYHPGIIYFTASKDKELKVDSSKRARVYEKLMKRYLDDYDITSRDRDEAVYFTLRKKS